MHRCKRPLVLNKASASLESALGQIIRSPTVLQAAYEGRTFFLESVLGFKRLENLGVARPTFNLIQQVNSGKGILVSLSLKTLCAQLHVTAIKIHVC